MKKYLKLFSILLVLLVLAGCGKQNKLVCSATMDEEGVKMTGEITALFDSSNKFTDAEVTYILDNETTAQTYCSLFKLAEDEEKGIKVECSGKKITIKGFGNMIADDEDDEELKNMTKEDFKKYMESSEEAKYTCK